MPKVYFFMNDSPGGIKPNRMEVWFPHTGDGYFDKSLQRYFDTKQEKRNFLRNRGWREAGELYNPEKRVEGEGAAIKRRK